MTATTAIVAFALAAALLTVTPGLDMALILRAAALAGPRRALAAAAGVCCGLLTWGLAVALGLGALLAASHLAYAMLRWAGAAYLFWLGLNALLRPRGHADLPEVAPAARDSAKRWFARGLLCNLLNPKVGVFYVTFLPQFVPAGVPVAPFVVLLVTIHVAEGIPWLSLLVLATRPLLALLRRPAVVRALDRLTGLVLVGFGLRLALEQRR